jgi:hypothetical protein
MTVSKTLSLIAEKEMFRSLDLDSAGRVMSKRRIFDGGVLRRVLRFNSSYKLSPFW